MPTVIAKTLENFLSTLALCVQRHSAWCPPWIKSVGKCALQFASQSKCQEIDDWSAPLIAHGPTTPSFKMPQVGSSEPSVTVQLAELAPENSRNVRRSVHGLRCLIVTRALD